MKNYSQMEQIKPSLEALKHMGKRKKTIQSANELHTLLMMEGDMTAQEIRLHVRTKWMLNMRKVG